MAVPNFDDSALVDQTNSDHTSLPGSPTTGSIDDPTYCGKRLRRARPFRRSQFSIDSDDNLSSEHWSIYNAEHVLSDENVTIKDDPENNLDWQPTPAIIPLSPSLENLSQIAEQPLQGCEPAGEMVITSHSGWSATQLEPIIEQQSFSSLRRSSSLSRIRSRPARPLSTIVSELEPPEEWPTDSQRPSYCPWSRLRQNDGQYGRRSFSENDVACMPLPPLQNRDQKDVHSQYSSNSSSSSEEIRRRLSQCPIFPHRPHRPPPDRVPTPPGIPSFGTREAVALLTPQPQRPREFAYHSLRTWQQNTSTLARQMGTPEGQSPEIGPSDSNVTFRRSIWNWLRLGSPPSNERTTVSELRNAGLPADFVPRAEDGTLVRGMFGGRGSGHGVGSRPQGVRGIESHPFHSRMSNIAEIIQEIDKACEAAGNDRVQDESLPPPRIPLPSHRKPDQGTVIHRPELTPNFDVDNLQLVDASRVRRDQASGSDFSGTRILASPPSIISPDGISSGLTSTRATISPRRGASPDGVSNNLAIASLNGMINPSAPSSTRAVISPRRAASGDTLSCKRRPPPASPRSVTFSAASPIFIPPFSSELGRQEIPIPSTMSRQSLTQRHEADIANFMSGSERYMAERRLEEEKYRGEFV